MKKVRAIQLVSTRFKRKTARRAHHRSNRNPKNNSHKKSNPKVRSWRKNNNLSNSI